MARDLGHPVLVCHQVAGVGFYDQPDFAAGMELEGIAGGQSYVDFHFYSTICTGGYDYVPLLQREQASGKYVAGAQAFGFDRGQQDVAGANAD